MLVGGDGELAVRKQEETKQEKSQQAQGHEETRARQGKEGKAMQLGKDWKGPRKEKVCVCAG